MVSDDDDVRQTPWAEQQRLLENAGGINGLVEKLEETEAVYDLTGKEPIIVCIDERIIATSKGKGEMYYYVRSAGTFILLDEESRKAFLESSGAKIATWHKECGAATKKYGETHSGAESSPEDIDAYAQNFVESLKEELDLETREIGIESPGFHPAIGVIYQGVDMDPFQIDPELPKFFGINRNHTPKKYALEELQIALDIAFGDHGFNDLFDEENPFYIIVAGNPNNPDLCADILCSEVNSVLENTSYKEKVLVKAYDARI
ncbi:MAG: hypothetical protein KAJ24_00470 [Candidatus Aenigmarchaeota archaeon]|nr:hypothetical protein [Candidatus Aenigmarchaeota archaeon]